MTNSMIKKALKVKPNVNNTPSVSTDSIKKNFNLNIQEIEQKDW